MEKENRLAAAYLLIGISAAGRAFLAMPEGVELQELSLTVLALVGYLLFCRRTWKPLACGIVQVILELILCGSQSGGIWMWLMPVLRSVDLWGLLLASVLMLRQIGQAKSLMPAVAAPVLAVYTVSRILSKPPVVYSAAFIVFSLLLLWYAILMLRAYNAARVQK